MPLINRMTLRGLLGLLVALASALLLAAGGVYIGEQYTRWKSATATGDFVNVMLFASRLVHQAQRERGLSAGYLANANALEPLHQQRTNTDAAAAAFSEASLAWKGVGSEAFARITASLPTLNELRNKVDARSINFADAAAAYTAIISTSTNALSATATTLAATSVDELLVATTTAYVDLEWAKEFHGRERAQTNAILGAGAISTAQRDLLMSTRALGRNSLELVRVRAPDVALAVERATAASAQTITDFRAAVAREAFSEVQPKAWWTQITAYIDGLWAVMEDQAETIRGEAAAQADAARKLFIAGLTVGLTGIAVFGALAWVVAARLNSALGEMRRVITEVESSGDFSKRMTYSASDEVGQAARAFNSLLTQFAAIIREVQQSGGSIADAARVMAESSAEVIRSSSAQSEAAASVAAAVEETSVSIAETANNAHDADEVVDRARNGIDLALDTMRETMGSVEAAADLIRDASNNVGLLDESSKKIGGIVQVIKEIADQTNLLALNAAIEAARAGEQGRGFAVVADEVRKLAERTSLATQEIGKLIAGIQTRVDGTVSHMHSANEQTRQSLDLVAHTETAIRSADDAAAIAATNVRSIAEAVREQNSAVQQVAHSIESIAQMTEENSAAAHAAGETASRLDALSGKLRESVARYRA